MAELNAGTLRIQVVTDGAQAISELERVKGAASGLGGAMSTAMGHLMANAVTAGAKALASGLQSAINTGMQFEASMSQVAAISGATGAELERLTETAKHYGETTMFSASQAAEALNYMALAGWDTQQSIDALGGVLDLAAASGMDLGAASDAVTDYLSAFSMEASQAGYMADLMAYAQARSNTTATMLADAYGNCASTMHASGQDIETTTAMLMALANQGIKGSEAGTQMSAVMRDLTQKMEDGHVKIGDTSVAVQDAAGNFRDLNDIMADVGAAVEGMGTAEKSAALMETFSARSVKAVNTILNEGLENVNQYEEALRDSEGTAAEQSKTMMDNLAGDVKIFQSALEGVQITASETMNETARAIVQEGTGFLTAINQGGQTGGIGGMFDAAIDQIPALLPKAVSGMNRLIQGIGSRLPGLTRNLVRAIPAVLSGAGELVPGLITSLTDAAAAAVEGLIGNLPNILGGVVSAVPDVLGSLVRGAGSVFEGGVSGLVDAFLPDVKLPDYESLYGSVTGELTYNVDVEANVSYEEAQAKVDEELQSFVDSLKEHGLSTEDIAQVLAFTGTAEELDAYLEENFPNLDEAAKRIIQDKFKASGEGGLASLFAEGEKFGLTAEDIAGVIVGTDLSEASVQEYLETNFPDLGAAAKAALTKSLSGSGETAGLADSLKEELKDLGLKPEDIAAILTAQAEGDDSTIESILTEKYADVYDQAKGALQKAWDAGKLTSGVEGGSATFIADLFTDMFTNGQTDSPEAVDAGLESAKKVIDAKMQALRDYIAKGGEDTEGAEQALDYWQQYSDAIEAFAHDYANMSTKDCAAAAQEILALADATDAATARVLANSQKLQSDQAIRYRAGVQGSELSAEDATMALDYLTNLTADREKAAQEARDAAMQGALSQGMQESEALEAANKVYSDMMNAALAKSRQELAALVKGQAGDQPGLQGAAALSTIWDQLLETGEPVTVGDVTEKLQAAGFDPSVINQAIAQLLTPYGGVITEGFSGYKGTEGLDGLNLSDSVREYIEGLVEGVEELNPSELVQDLLANDEIGNDYDLINQIMLAMFDVDGNTGVTLPDLTQLLSGYDFGTLGSLIRTAAEKGLIEGVTAEDVKDPEFVNTLIAQLLGDGLKPTETPEVEVPVDTKVTEGETDTEPLTEGVDEAVEESAGRERPRQEVRQEIEVVPEVETAEDTGDKVTEAVESDAGGAGNETVSATVDVVASVGDVTVDGAESIGQAIDEAAAAGMDGGTLSGAVADAVSSAISAGEGAADGASSIGSAMDSAAGSGMDGSALSGAAGNAVSAAISAGSSAASGASAIGQNLISGATSGVQDAAGKLATAAAEAVRKAVQAAKNAAEIKSPSRVMKREVGQMLAQGMAVGVEDESRSVKKRIQDATKGIVSGAAQVVDKGAFTLPALPGAQTDYAAMGAAMRQAMDGVNFSFGVNGRELARAQRSDTGREQVFRSRQINSGYGMVSR